MIILIVNDRRYSVKLSTQRSIVPLFDSYLIAENKMGRIIKYFSTYIVSS